MDIFSHGLWAAAAAKGVNLKIAKPRKLNAWLALWWGMFPDLFAFAIPFIGIAWSWITGTPPPSAIPRPEVVEPAVQNGSAILHLAYTLYNYSHSLVIFALVIALVVVVKKLRRKDTLLAAIIPWEMGGWLLHILMDIPTHTYRFFPTPLFWPLASWKFDGFSWATPWFLITDYGLLIIVFVWIVLRERKTVKRKPLPTPPS